MAIGVGRRQFISALGGVAMFRPFATHAQQTRNMRTVGIILSGAESDAESQTRIVAFRQGFEELGWKDRQDVHIEYRWVAGNSDLIEQYTREIVALRPDVILANGTGVVVALQKLTSTIPIVCVLVNDPVGLGFVKSLARPGGNITGFTYIDPDMISKWMGLLKEVTPDPTGAPRCCSIQSPPFRYYRSFSERNREPARLAGSARPLEALPGGHPCGVGICNCCVCAEAGRLFMIGPDAFMITHIAEIAQLVANNRVPTISVYRPFTVAGGLMSYGPDTADIFRQAASYVDRILKGERPADLPVQQPTKFEFIVNLKAAKSLGLTIPSGVVAIADEVIE